ncbi:glucosamine-6-phosphate deaminase [Mucilaginibacter conchicola]|uniref:Glucosamine-6-phosphate deaminase n=1 Tax=Mucilaginibacter conchicola TaxID=2303333 RepID=A0A372NQ47_9SPHI|nr:glucosamine-6-phosphate deaminase [Mucilaginibacter conchicola]RFZ90988.1 glucosamine-6-phosphate deaminase [Mucilaginibacter conchicola]
MIKTIQKDKLKVLVLPDRAALGQTAAAMVSDKIKELLSTKGDINIIFAAAPSQDEFLSALIADERIEWDRINAFHMDEYLGLPDNAPQLFSSFLKRSIFYRVPFKSVNCINGNASDAEAECERYAVLLKAHPTDIVCMGIGENTHIAFNDPHVAEFNDLKAVKTVTLDMACRQQQVNDGCFEGIDDVPKYAITLTVPTLMSGAHLFCMVPGANKRAAVNYTLTAPVSETYPSTILRTHNSCVLFADTNSLNTVD